MPRPKAAGEQLVGVKLPRAPSRCEIAPNNPIGTLRLEMATIVSKPAKRKPRPRAQDPEERSLVEFNRLIAQASPLATQATAAALDRFRRDIAAEIRRAG